MAEILLARFRIITDRGSGFTPGKFVESYWDDVADVIKSYLKDFRSDPPGTPLVTGPDLGNVGWRGRSDFYDSFLEYPQYNAPIPYSFCDVTALNSFKWKSTFPYITKTVTENHFSCVSVVCDIQITSSVAGDDSISVVATSSNGVIRYSLDPNFQYSSGQLSGTFNDLFAGTYTVTAMDELNCIAQIDLIVGASTEYGVKYRLDLKSVKGVLCRLDIEERAYEGELIEICAGSHAPIFLNGNNEGLINRFSPILPSEIEAVLLSQTNFYFQELFNADDRKYRLKYYEDRGGGYELESAGYCISQNHKEDYKQPPYPVTIVAVDCLADLKNYDFKDQSDNVYQNIDYTLLSLIVDILSKTDLRLNICMAVNKYEQDMDTELDPFEQVAINPRIFDGKKCYEALSEILKPFGARILLRNGEWLIYCIEQQVTDVQFRRFDYLGEFIEEGSYSDIVGVRNPSSTAWFRRDSAVLEQIYAYGLFDLVYNLMQNQSLLKAYSFEEEDLISYPDGTVAFNGWNVNISEDDGATFGIKETNSFEGKWNFFYKVGTETNDAIDSLFVVATAQTRTIEYDVTDTLKLSIDLSAISTGNRLYHAHFQWSLKIGDYYYNASDGEWTTDEDYKYNNVFIKTFNDKQTVETVINFRNVEELTVEDFVFEMKLNREINVAFATTSSDPGVYEPLLSAIETLKLPLGYLLTGRTNGTSASGRFRVYELVDGPAEGDQIEPDDYHADDNNKVWSEVSVMGRRSALSYWYVDNVRVVHLPGGFDAPQSITTEKVNNINFKNNFEETYLLNDIDIENINNSERTYRNFFKLLDGSPTQVWTRTWRAGQGKLLDLLADELASQYKRTSYKITSPFGVSIDGEVWPSTILRDEFDNDRKYMFMGYSRDVINDEISSDLHEIIDVTDDESPDIDAGFTIGFSLGFRS